MSVYFGAIILQTIVRLFCDPNWAFISEKGFIYLTSGIFIYFLGVVIVITKALWDETPFTGLHKYIFKNSKNKDK